MLPEYWAVKNDGSKEFREFVIGYVANQYKWRDWFVPYNHYIAGSVRAARVLESQPSGATLLTIRQFLEKIDKPLPLTMGDLTDENNPSRKTYKFAVGDLVLVTEVDDLLRRVWASSCQNKIGMIKYSPLFSDSYEVKFDDDIYSYQIPEACLTLQGSTFIDRKIDFSDVNAYYFGNTNPLPSFAKEEIKTNQIKIKINYEHKIKITV